MSEVEDVEIVDKIIKDTKDIVKEEDSKFIVDKSVLIEDAETGEKYVTITINQDMLHFLGEGLASYKAKFIRGQLGETAEKEREEVTQLIEEINKVKNILVGEPEANEKLKLKVEPNPVVDTKGTKDST